MRVPAVRGVIERRLLINYRVDPGALAGILPAPFRPQLVSGYAVGGICLIRLGEIRPRGLPAAVGMSSENAAHRIAVEWKDGDVVRRGVYIPRRDTSSRLSTLLGGRLFPGVHHRAAFSVRESSSRFDVALRSADDDTRVSVVGNLSASLPTSSVFRRLAEASAFFEAGAIGYSTSRQPGKYDGLELRTEQWRVEPLDVEHVASSFFDDARRFPADTAVFDSALVMRNVSHEWHAQPTLCGGTVVEPAA